MSETLHQKCKELFEAKLDQLLNTSIGLEVSKALSTPFNPNEEYSTTPVIQLSKDWVNEKLTEWADKQFPVSWANDNDNFVDWSDLVFEYLHDDFIAYNEKVNDKLHQQKDTMSKQYHIVGYNYLRHTGGDSVLPNLLLNDYGIKFNNYIFRKHYTKDNRTGIVYIGVLVCGEDYIVPKVDFVSKENTKEYYLAFNEPINAINYVKDNHHSKEDCCYGVIPVDMAEMNIEANLARTYMYTDTNNRSTKHTIVLLDTDYIQYSKFTHELTVDADDNVIEEDLN